MNKKPAIFTLSIICLSILLLTPLYCFECDCLDPRHEIVKEFDTEIKGTAKTLFGLGKLDGELNTRFREEVRNLHINHPDAQAMDLNSRLIYFFCIMLKDSDLTDSQKLDSYNEFMTAIKKTESSQGQNNPSLTELIYPGRNIMKITGAVNSLSPLYININPPVIGKRYAVKANFFKKEPKALASMTLLDSKGKIVKRVPKLGNTTLLKKIKFNAKCSEYKVKIECIKGSGNYIFVFEYK